ncbi:hypothetical protein [Haladaptatus pallidirubidus]|uniref:hypothetical protein n=1 Tax=Haladaptatus pallidirubidus TaxID=1008152 RepID=UPI001D0F90E7|nr:hypothetical protein [Haladaptatus pallidirubidus]
MSGTSITGVDEHRTPSRSQNDNSAGDQIRVACDQISFFTKNLAEGSLSADKTVLVFVVFEDESQIEVETVVNENGVIQVDLPGNRTPKTVTLVYEEGEDLLVTEFLDVDVKGAPCETSHLYSDGDVSYKFETVSG